MPTTTSAGPKPGIQKLDLSGLTKPKASKKTAYPVLPDPNGEVAPLVEVIRKEAAEFDALKGSFEIHKAELAAIATPFYFQNAHGMLEVPSSVACYNGTEEVLVTFTSRYKKPGDTAETQIAEIIGEEYGEHIRQGFTLKIDGDQIPPEIAQDVVNDLQAVLAKHRCGAALTADAVLKPVSTFHAARHRLFTPAINQAINLVLPIVTMVKTKGRGFGK